MRLAVFASGRGSNMLAIANAIEEGRLPGVSIDLVVCDKPSAPVLKKAQELKLNTFVFEAKKFRKKSDYESEILKQLEQSRIQMVVLAGFMRIIGPTLLKVWEGRMINLHPSLLPEFPGKDGIGDAFRAGVRETGVTVHFVDAGVDTGPIIAQERLMIDPAETLDSLKEKIHLLEHQILPQSILRICREGLPSVWENARTLNR
jgi:phosphoribosylglycinamide formyltransferase-1